jgi:hypothetical protein
LSLAFFMLSLTTKMRAHVAHVLSGVMAIISVFMSHRHRYEPSDGRLLPMSSMSIHWRVAVGR